MIKIWVNDNEFLYVCSLQEITQPDGTIHVVLNSQNVTDLRARLEPFDKNEEIEYTKEVEGLLQLDGRQVTSVDE